MRFPLAPAAGTLAALAAVSICGPLPPASAQGTLTGVRPNTAANSAQALAARDRAFAILDGQVKGGVEEPPMAMLGVPDLDTWLFRRYYSITEDQTLSPRQRERMIAGTIHQDLQLAEYGLTTDNPLVQKKALRVATIANLYVGMLPADPRLQAALYEGFLLPNVAMAPEKGWGARAALLEGASVAYGMSGRADQQIQTLRNLLNFQKSRSNVPGADIARIHLSDALEGRSQFPEAIQQLDAVTTPDLLGAKKYLGELRRKNYEYQLAFWERYQAQLAAERAAAQGNTAGVSTQNAAQNTDANGNGTNTGGIVPAVAKPELPPGGFGTLARGGRRFAQNNGGRGNGGETGGTEQGAGDVIEGESEKMRRMRLAAEAAQVAKELTKKADELSTISLAKMLDAADAQRALEAAEKGEAQAPRRGARLNDGTAASAPDIFTLRRTAENLARAASEAAGDAKRATVAAQEASEEAAKLALRVFIVDHDTPKEGEAPAQVTANALAPVAIQPAPPEQPKGKQPNGATPADNTENQTR